MQESTGANYLASVRSLFRYYKGLGEKAMYQIDDEQLVRELSPDANSIAVIVGHLSGNMLSRWTDFLNSDGEKPWRKRDEEFEPVLMTRAQVMEAWEKGWQCLFAAINPLTEEDLHRIIYIRNEGHTVLEAVNRQLAHYSYHVGQMIILAKMFKGSEWESLSIPKGGSKTFNEEKFNKDKDRRHFV
jgi:hypothetical protein